MDNDRAQWGYHPGGWGKPPVDEYNRPLYGDVFGTVVTSVPAEVLCLKSIPTSDNFQLRIRWLSQLKKRYGVN
jgi:hypothetical protein